MGMPEWNDKVPRMKAILTMLVVALWGATAPAQDFARVHLHHAPASQPTALVEIQMDKGWKTYWRSPGEAGIPPHFDWSGSENLAAAQVLWPAPEVFETYGIIGYGWHDRAVFPVQLTAKDPQKPLILRLKLDFGVCKDVCAPASATTELTLSPGAKGNASAAPLLAAALARLPLTPAQLGINPRCTLTQQDKKGVVRVDHGGVTAKHVIIEAGSNTVFDTPQPNGAAGWTASFASYGKGGPIDPTMVIVTLLDESRAIEFKGCTSG